MTGALFVFSTGRCGTQWLAGLLSAALDDHAVVAHEPLGEDYAPRAMLSAGEPENLEPDLAEIVREHVAGIEETLTTREYVECGHPLWSSLPYLLRRFAGRARVVHLVRHPVPTALSWVSMTAYVPPLVAYLPEKTPLSSFDEGVHFTSYRERWKALTPYEKALFYWAEINAFGLRLEAEANVPWLRVRFEDLVRDRSALRRLLEFACANAPGDVTPPPAVDRFQTLTSAWSDPRLIKRHPDVMQVARALGYDPLAFDAAKLLRRYCGE